MFAVPWHDIADAVFGNRVSRFSCASGAHPQAVGEGVFARLLAAIDNFTAVRWSRGDHSGRWRGSWDWRGSRSARMMLEAFGNEYTAYMARTKLLVPGIC